MSALLKKSKKLENCIFEIYGKRVISYSVVINGHEVGRFRDLEIARKVRDKELSTEGTVIRKRRKMGTGGIIFDKRNGRYQGKIGNKHICVCATYNECENILDEYINSLPRRTWLSGHDYNVERSLPYAPST